MNIYGIQAIFMFEMNRFFRTIGQSIASPVISTALYFIVFGSAIGGRIPEVDGIGYGAFIVPGLTLMTVMTQAISNASFGFYLPKFTGTIYEMLSAPVSAFEIVIGFVGAAALKSFIIGLVILATAAFFVELRIAHPIWLLIFLTLSCFAFSLLGFLLAIWAKNFDQLQIVPLLIITPMVFLGGTFYSISMLPPFWQNVTLFNPVVYLISGFRWSFFDVADVNVAYSIAAITLFLGICLALIWWIFKTGWRIRN